MGTVRALCGHCSAGSNACEKLCQMRFLTGASCFTGPEEAVTDVKANASVHQRLVRLIVGWFVCFLLSGALELQGTVWSSKELPSLNAGDSCNRYKARSEHLAKQNHVHSLRLMEKILHLVKCGPQG